jgi:GNAT superfamily N-acetyltransferase
MESLDLGRRFRAYCRKIYDHHRAVWMVRPLDEALHSSHMEFDAHLVVDDSDRVLEFVRRLEEPGTFDPGEIRSIRERGHLVVGLRAGDEWIGFSKLGWDLVYVLDYRIDLQLPPGAFFVMDSYVRPEWRGRGAGRFLLSATSFAMRDRGFTTRISHIRLDNARMRALGSPFGYREIGIVDFRSFLGTRRLTPHPATLLAREFETVRGVALPAVVR